MIALRAVALTSLALLCVTASGAAQAPRDERASRAARQASPAATRAATRAARPSRFLYVWAGPTDTSHAVGADAARSDFLAVVDLAPETPGGRYGRVVATVPVGARHTMAHHAEQAFTAGRHYFASGFMSGQLFRFDVTDRARPRLAGLADSVRGLRQPHSVARLPDGRLLATVQFGIDSAGSRPGGPGGLVEFDDAGRVVRTASAADSAFAALPIRPYGLAVAPALDRVVTTSAAMDSERVADVIQVWRLSDFRLLRTIALPPRADSAHRDPFEARVLPDGRSVLVNTYRCGFYRIADLETLAPRAEFVLALPGWPGCAVPVVVGRYWVMPIAYQHRVAVLDVSRAGAPREVSSLPTDSTFFPHWSAADPGSDRIVVTEQGDGLPRVMIARLDARTGRLRWDRRFREPGAARPGLDFGRATWPHGAAGAAMPHAAVFVPQP
jgi:hypothetical protein